jgi:hypothetical protein
MGAGKAIVSTPYAYASEQLAEGRGRLVAAGSCDALAAGLIELALSSKLRAEYGRKVYAHGQGMYWPEIGAAYRQIFTHIAGLQPQGEHDGPSTGLPRGRLSTMARATRRSPSRRPTQRTSSH